MPFDFTISPLYRIGGQEMPALPGLLAVAPPRANVARIREQDRLVVYLLLTGTAVFTTSEYAQVAQDAAKVFYATPGSTTNALRVTSESVNKVLLDRNMSTTDRGQYTIGWLTLGVLRDAQFTFSQSGPMHLYYFGQDQARHYFDPQVSGKGLGANQVTNLSFGLVSLQAGDRIFISGRIPAAWNSTLEDAHPSSLDAMRRRLVTLTTEDLNAALVQVTDGTGQLNLLQGGAPIESKVEPKKEEKPEEKPMETGSTAVSAATTTPPPSLISKLPRRQDVGSTTGPLPAIPASEDFPAPREVEVPIPASVPDTDSEMPAVQPSAYAIPPQYDEPVSQPLTSSTNPLDRLPRAIRPLSTGTEIAAEPTSVAATVSSAGEKSAEAEKLPTPAVPVEKVPEPPREPSENARRAAKLVAGSIQATRRAGSAIGERLGRFLPRLLPNSGPNDALAPSNTLMMFMAILIPLIVVTVSSVVYLRYGRSQQYEMYLLQAQQMRETALTLSAPIEQRKAWENVLLNVDIAESHRKTSDTIQMRAEAEANLDKLLGITRLQFNPVFSSGLGIEISRLAASESDLFMLNAATGEVLRAQLTSGRGFQLDTAFSCKPGVYGDYTVGNLVDIIAMPTLNSINATLLGVDATGNLLYCAPGQVAQAIPLPVPDTNWGRVTAFTLDGGNLYVLDAPARAVWVYNGKDGTFIDRPYFFFGGQTPEKQDVIDLVVTGDDLYMLHSDGHISTCSYSRIESIPTRCQDPMPLINPFASYQDMDLFGTAHFTQMLFSAAPDTSILLLDADTQGVMRFAQRTLELQNQFRPTTGTDNPVPSGPVGAVTVGPNHVLYLALNGQVYFASMP